MTLKLLLLSHRIFHCLVILIFFSTIGLRTQFSIIIIHIIIWTITRFLWMLLSSQIIVIIIFFNTGNWFFILKYTILTYIFISKSIVIIGILSVVYEFFGSWLLLRRLWFYVCVHISLGLTRFLHRSVHFLRIIYIATSIYIYIGILGFGGEESWRMGLG